MTKVREFLSIEQALQQAIKDLKDEGLKKDIKFRTSKFNIKEDFKDIVSEQLFNNISKIRKDFETHLENFDKDKTN